MRQRDIYLYPFHEEQPHFISFSLGALSGQFDLYPFHGEQPHPMVILSTDERCANPDLPTVNALFCTPVRSGREPKGNGALLDEADGLDWRTAVRCDVIHLLPKPNFQDVAVVSPNGGGWRSRGK